MKNEHMFNKVNENYQCVMRSSRLEFLSWFFCGMDRGAYLKDTKNLKSFI